MNFENRHLTRSALFFSALFLAGCVSEPPPAPAEKPAPPEELSLEQIVSEALSPKIPKLSSAESHTPEETDEELARLNAETETLTLERKLIEARLGLASAEDEKLRASAQLEKMALEASVADASSRLDEEIAGVEAERAELERRLALETALANARVLEKQNRLKALEIESRAVKAEMSEKTMGADFSVALADRRAQLSKLAPDAARSPKYLKEPFVDGTLYISDRRVSLNGPVTPELARDVCEQLYFYDNQNSDYPIFLVIDHSPGGSVAAGYQIQKAMQSCRAPVYVVVKNLAASMAAVIATTAERSYCFANTRILHHQISSSVKGNLTVMREGVEEGELWAQRFLAPVARKMGLSLDELVEEMYANSSDGDWIEAGKRAVELKWIDNLATRIEETGVISIAGSGAGTPTPTGPSAEEKIDAQGRRFVELPVLENPFDFWAIYDENDYYRAR